VLIFLDGPTYGLGSVICNLIIMKENFLGNLARWRIGGVKPFYDLMENNKKGTLSIRGRTLKAILYNQVGGTGGCWPLAWVLLQG